MERRSMGATAVLIVTAALALVSSAAAEPAATRPARPDTHTVYIPYKDLQKVFEKSGRGVYLPHDEFMRLWERARGPAAQAEPPVSALITKAAYTGAVKDDLATIEAVYEVQVLKAGWTRVPVGLTGVATAKATLAGEPARLVANPRGGYDLLVSDKGAHELRVTFVAPLKSQPGLKSFSFGSPSVPVSQLDLTIPEKDVKVDVQPLLAATRTPAGEAGTHVMAFLGATGSVRVSWKPRPVDVATLTPVVFAVTDTHTTVTEGVMRTAATLAIDVLRAPVSAFKVALPKDVRLIAVKGENLKDWTLSTEAARQVLAVELHAGVTGDYRLTLRLERLLADGVKQVVVPEVSLLGAQRETGHVAVSTESPLRAEVLAQANLSQMDINELPKALKRGERVLGYRFLKHPYELKLGLTRITPRIEAQVVNRVTIEKNRLALDARVAYTIRKVGVFRLQVQVPAGFDVLAVGDRGTVADYRVRPVADGTPTVIEIDLPRRVIGALRLPVRLEKARPTLAGRVTLPTVEALDADREDGTVAVLAPEALKVVSAAAAGLIPVEAADLRRDGVPQQDDRGNRLAFGYRYRRRPFTAEVDVTQRKTKVTAEVLTRYDVRRDLIRARALLRFDVRYAGRDTFAFQAPAAVADRIKVTGDGLKEHKPLPPKDGWVTWRVLTQTAATGVVAFAVEYDLPLKADTPAVMPVIRVKEADPAVERETGQIAIVKAADLAVAPTTKALERIDPRELDDALRRDDVVVACKYYDTDYGLTLAVTRHAFAEVATTVATKAALESIVTKDGAVTARARWRVKTTDKQFLVVRLPAGADLRGAAVDGVPVRPQQGAQPDEYLLRLGGGAGAERESLVALVYAMPAPGSARRLDLAAPTLGDNVPVQKLYWVLSLSEDRAIRAVTTDLNDETVWALRWSGIWPGVTSAAPVDLDGWIDDHGSSAATFEPPADAQTFLLSGMDGAHAVTVTSSDRRVVGVVIVAVLVVIGLVFALARTAIKILVIVLLVAAALLAAVVNQTAVLQGVSAGSFGLTAIIVIWVLEFIFVRIPRSVRRRRAAIAALAEGEEEEEEPGDDGPAGGEPPAPPDDGGDRGGGSPAPTVVEAAPQPPPPEPEPPAPQPAAPARPQARRVVRRRRAAPRPAPQAETPASPPAEQAAAPEPKPETTPTPEHLQAPKDEPDNGPYLTNGEIDRLVDEVLLKPGEQGEGKEEKK